MTTPDFGPDDEGSVTIRLRDNSSVGVRFCDRFSFDQDTVRYTVELQAPGLAAQVNEVVAWMEAGEQLTSLAADVRHFFAREPR